MNAGFYGLGLIGGSMAKAYMRSPEWHVYGTNRNPSVTQFALLDHSIHEELTDAHLPELDILFLAVYPKACVELLRQKAPLIGKNCLVIDVSGVKGEVCRECFAIADAYGFLFVGGHPMAGTHHSGLKYARADLFDGQPMVIVPPVFDDIELIARIQTLLAPARFGRFSVITAQEHDRRIAFTSQMAHVVSNAYIKSPTARDHAGFSAGSYKDLTRVAYLNADMWAELFMMNRDALLYEMDTFMDAMEAYREALKAGDQQKLKTLLQEGSEIKAEVDGVQ